MQRQPPASASEMTRCGHTRLASVMRIPSAPKRRVFLLQRAAVCLFGPRGSVI
jgi:hypothetical protein